MAKEVYGYRATITENENGELVKEISGGTYGEASRVLYDQVTKSGDIVKVPVQKKLSEIDEVLSQDFVMADTSNAYSPSYPYKLGETCIRNEKVYEALQPAQNKDPAIAANVGPGKYWKELTLKELNNKYNDLKNTLMYQKNIITVQKSGLNNSSLFIFANSYEAKISGGLTPTSTLGTIADGTILFTVNKAPRENVRACILNTKNGIVYPCLLKTDGNFTANVTMNEVTLNNNLIIFPFSYSL